MLATLKMSKESLRVQEFKMSSVSEHPNKVPFKCALFAVDQPSDGSPHGAGGKKIRISSAVCDKYLQTFVGMALNIDYVHGMSDHDPRFKVAVIEKAYRSMDGFAWVEGYIFGKDFPDVVATIRYYNSLASENQWSEYQFGASLEMEAAVQDAMDTNDVLDVIEFCGTGAAILFADAAAYTTTSFAAKNNSKEVVNTMTPEESKALQDAMIALTASMQSVVTDMGTIKSDVESMKAAQAEGEQQAAEQTKEAELTAAKEEAERYKQELATLKAGNSAAQEPQRKTVSAAQLLNKIDASNGADGLDYTSFCAAVDKMNLPTVESMKLKLQAKSELK
ncbi:3-oxoacyl-ACP reductase [Paenibacillus selenitireducens]|uniref:3-oxoacyl-ACP reductase n=1 Tax=Paenibacillus selenitireducens TaxID=1324314 RepID=A0A1T2XC90_9BACL|nr:3-oxoacyl-ACP reductase [Paenibacillus selenitireducens]OPA77460.1 3-oxoacyl-ACP reductase [Paenibacillus selenitireducens]